MTTKVSGADSRRAGTTARDCNFPIPRWEQWKAAFVVCALAVPYLAAILTVIAHGRPLLLPRWNDLITGNSFLIGVCLAFPLWLLVSLIPNRFAAADGVNVTTYKELCSRRDLLHSNLQVLCSDPPACVSMKALACGAGTAYREGFDHSLRCTGLQWLWGSGYIDLWRTLHRGEEELIGVQPPEALSDGAVTDHLRLHDSTIPNRDELMRDLNRAVHELDAKLAPYVTDITVATDNSAPAAETPRTAIVDAGREQRARAILKTVRRAINEYRDDQFSGLLQVRNRLLRTTMITEVAALLLLGLAITSGVGAPLIVGAAGFFVVGAVLGGLFSRLRTTIEADTGVDDDYGLSTARLWATPLFSGLAAVGGVVLVAVAPSVLTFNPPSSAEPSPAATPAATVTPSRTASPSSRLVILRQPAALAHDSSPAESSMRATTDHQVESVPPLQEIFTPNAYRLVVAALFGLVPAYFFDRLRQANTLLANIKSTEPTGRAGT